MALKIVKLKLLLHKQCWVSLEIIDNYPLFIKQERERETWKRREA